MNQLYYRDLRKRIETLEHRLLPEPEPDFIVYMQDEDGMPYEVMEVTKRIFWQREPGQPIPEKYLRFANPRSPDSRSPMEDRSELESGDAPWDTRVSSP